MVKLTAAAVERYRAGKVRREIRDDGAQGLHLIIQTSGHKSWALRFRRPGPAGKPAKLTLGPVDISGQEMPAVPVRGQPLTLAAARALASEVHRERAMGRDVVADHKARRHRQRTEVEERNASTFAAAVRNYIDEHAKPNTRNWLETARLLGLRYGDGDPEETTGGLAQRWADRPVRSIDASDVWAVVEEARRNGTPGIVARNMGISEPRARALFVALSSFFGWLQRQRRIESNPCQNMHRPQGAKARDRALSTDEIRWFWAACDTVDAPRVSSAPRPFAVVFRLLLLTGQRLNEVAGMRRDELRDDGTWHLPGSRTKNGRAHVVPLPASARAIIAAAKGTGDLVFSTTGNSPPSGWSRAKRRLDDAMRAVAKKTVAPWRLHDLRRTAITQMAEFGIRPDVIELVVNHVSGSRGGIAGVYNRSELMDERRAALERLANHIEGLVAGRPANVVELPRKARPK